MFDITKYIFECEGIRKFIHTNSKNPESIETQKRVLRRWDKQRANLLKATEISHEEMSEIQLRTISVMVDFAYYTHPFYHELYKKSGFKPGDIITWDDYHALPTINKDDLIDNYKMFQQRLGPQVSSAKTSGSSGRAVEVLIDPVIDDVGTVQEMRFYEQMLGRERDPKEWLYMIYLVAPPFSSLDGKYPIFTISNDCPPEIALEHIKKLKPKILTGFASYFNRMTTHIKNSDDLGIEAISTNSETSTPAERKKISKAFNAPVFDEYSSVELGYIATQCKFEEYHIVEDNVRIDILDPDENGIGTLVGTDLNNTYFPMIKYVQGDSVSIKDTDDICACGNHFRRLDSFGGRSDQALESKNIGSIPSDRIMSLYDKLLLTKNSRVEEFRIIQTDLNHIKIIIKFNDAYKRIDDALIKEFTSGLRELFQDDALNVSVKTVSEMPKSKSHKRKLIENRIKPK